MLCMFKHDEHFQDDGETDDDESEDDEDDTDNVDVNHENYDPNLVQIMLTVSTNTKRQNILLHYNILFDQPQQSPNGVTPVFNLVPTCTNWFEASTFLYIIRYHTIKSELIGVQGR